MSTKPRLPKSTKRIKVLDPTGKSRKGKEFNIAIRVDTETANLLEHAQRNLFFNRSQLTARFLTEFLDDFHSLDVQEDVKAAGVQKAKHPDEKHAMWQCHDREVVERVKKLEQSVEISRSTIGRAAAARYIRKHPTLCGVEIPLEPTGLHTNPANTTKLKKKSG